MKAKSRKYWLPLLLGGALSALPAAATVNVTFTDPDRYTDVGDYGADSKRAMREIAQYLKQLGQRYLPADQNLSIEILDMDLAGRVEWPSYYTYGVRVLRDDANWPRITLRYELRDANGQVKMQGKDDVSDPMYLQHTRTYSSGESLPYEKAMLYDWFKAHFAGKPARP